MPIALKRAKIAFKDPTTGEYQPVDTVSDRTTADRIADINAAGAEVIASIPADYTTLSNQVTAMQTGKQNTLTFDSAPTSSSANPVTSGGVYTAIANAAAKTPSKATFTSSSQINLPVNTNWFVAGYDTVDPYGFTGFVYYASNHFYFVLAGSSDNVSGVTMTPVGSTTTATDVTFYVDVTASGGGASVNTCSHLFALQVS